MNFYGMTKHNPGTNRLDFEWPWPKVKVTEGQKVNNVFFSANYSVENCRRQSPHTKSKVAYLII